ncbi:MAG: DUF3352 domain-containing protein [Chloroflexota bacterium]
MTDQDPTQRYEAPPAAEPAPTEPPVPPAPPEPVVAAPTAPVATPRPAGPGRSRLRWLVAGIVTLLVVGTAAGATFLLTRDAGDPDVLAWTPADSVVYTEARLDLPGGQQAELAKVMSAFPGFDDQAAFPTKLAEALDQLVKRASDDKMGYQADIEPWFGGQVSMSIGPLPSTADPTQVRALVLASVKDAAKAGAWAEALLTEAGATASTETYEGIEITTVTPPDVEAFARPVTGAYALFGPVIALGDPASIKAAIDTKGTGGLPTHDQFAAASGSVSGDRLGFLYLNAAAIAQGAQGLAGDTGASMPELPAMFDDLSAPWVVMAVRAEDGAIVVDTRQPHVDKLGPAAASESKVAALVPASTVFLATGHDVGAGLERLRALAADDPELADGVKQLEDSLALVGGVDALIGWIGDAGLAITRDGDELAGGLVITPTDRAAAGRLLTQLRGFLALAGQGAGITVTDEDHGGTTITSITIENVGDLLGAATGGSLDGPDDVPDSIVIAYAVSDEVVTIGYTADFVKAVLDTRGGESLATTDRFKGMLDRADKVHGSLSWVDVAAIRDLVEGMIPDEERGEYDADVKPYLAAFDAIIATSVPGDDLDTGTIVMRVVGQ